MGGRAHSLEQYAERRKALAGGALLADHAPFLVPFELRQQECEAKGLQFLSFAHYDYLSLAQDPRVRRAAADAIETFGTGAGASRLVGGERAVHRALERALADFTGCEDALALVSGYGTNVALLGHLLTTGDLIIVDEYAHNSILTGTKLSRAETLIFSHNDLDELAAVLAARRGRYRRALVVVEGLYSMDGDVPDLPRLLEVCEQHNAWLMIDEAHSIGVLGRTGRGICEHYGVDPGRVDLIVGTLSKAFVTCGGFVCAKAAVIEWLRYTLPGFVYSVGLPPHIAATVRTALSLLEREPERVQRLQAISEYFVATARRFRFDTGSAIGAGVVPVKFEDPPTTFQAAKALMEKGIYVPPVVQIGVPKDMPRLRFFLSAQHTAADIDRVFDVLSKWRENRADTEPAKVPPAALAEPKRAVG